jgi:penicillin-binding protein 1A
MDGQVIGRFYIQDRTPVEFDDISEYVLMALIATEDKRFYEHNGIDWQSLPRVLFRSVLISDESAGGGSTISQQLVKNLFPRQHMGSLSLLKNKIKEMITARRIENIYTKNEILTLYLNTVPFGENTFGIEAASERFFNKKCLDLEIEEAALLVGILKATTYYNPRNHPERAVLRRNTVIGQMAKTAYISATEADSVSNIPLQIHRGNEIVSKDQTGYLLELVRQQATGLMPLLSDSLGRSYNMYTDGLVIHTTVHSVMQQYAEEAVTQHLSLLQSDFENHWKNRSAPWENGDLIDLELKKAGWTDRFLKNEIPDDSMQQVLNQPVEMEVFSWEGPQRQTLSTIDSIKYYLKYLNAGFVGIDPHSGAILAWVGGIDHTYFKFDHAGLQGRRQVGSTFKPIVYATALERGISPCDYVKAEQETFVENEQKWSPSNTNDKYEGKYSMEGGLIHSVNTVAVKVLQDAGIEETIAIARQMGITSEIPSVPSIALGTPGISLVEMTGAYATFANKGASVKPYLIEYIEDGEGNIIWKRQKIKPRAVLSPETCMLMIEMMGNVINKGTASSLRTKYRLKNDIAGKTGTTQNNADGWFIATNPRLTVGVWVGGAYPSIHFRTTNLGQGAATALPVYGLFMQKMNGNPDFRSMTSARFDQPPAHLLDDLECDPFKEEFRLFEWLFGKTKEKEERPSRKKKGFFKKVGDLFGKKKKD